MASGNPDETDQSGSVSKDNEENSQDKPECAVCLQTCIQPVRLPCSHVFCYLCVKGVTHQNKRCAMCRQSIPSNFLDNPDLISVDVPKLAFEGSYQWFYEGRNGWWQYDERTSTEIESAFKKKEKQYEVLIAGYLYVIDFENYIQYRRNDQSKRRKIKRDLVSITKKGIAGVRLPASNELSVPMQNMSLSDSKASCCSKNTTSSQDNLSNAPGNQPSTSQQPDQNGTSSGNGNINVSVPYDILPHLLQLATILAQSFGQSLLSNGNGINIPPISVPSTSAGATLPLISMPSASVGPIPSTSAFSTTSPNGTRKRSVDSTSSSDSKPSSNKKKRMKKKKK